MDVDGNGIIDFNEFLMAMSLESSAANDKLQKAFQSFASMHRRRNIIDLLRNKRVPDHVKYNEFLTLFQKVDVQEAATVSVEEQCRIFKKQAGKCQSAPFFPRVKSAVDCILLSFLICISSPNRGG